MDEQDRTNLDGSPAFEPVLSTDDLERVVKTPEQLAFEREQVEVRRARLLVLKIVSVATVVIGGAAVIFLSFRQSNSPATPMDLSDLGSTTVDLDVVMPKMHEATRGFFEAGTMEERSQFVRDPDRVLPLMEEFYERTEFGSYRPLDIGFDAVYEIPVPDSENVLIFTSATLRDFSRRIFVFEWSPEGEARLDWESLVAYSSMSLEDFKDQRPTEPQTFRLVCRDSEFYVSPYTDREAYSSYRLRDYEWRHTIHAFCIRDSVADKRIREFQAEGEEQNLTLKLRYPENAARHDVVEIVAQLGTNWIEGLDLKTSTKALEPVPDLLPPVSEDGEQNEDQLN